MKAFRRAAILALTLFALAGPAAAQRDDLASELRRLYLGSDHHTAYRIGAEAEPGPGPARAWWLLAAARIGLESEALGHAERWTAAAPDDPWAWATLGGVLAQTQGRSDDAIVATDRLLESDRHDPDLWMIHADTLVYADQYDRALAFVDEHLDGTARTAQLLVVRASALFAMAQIGGAVDPEKFELALDASQQAIGFDPNAARAHYMAGVVLSVMRRSADALAHFERALELSPGAIRPHTWYWRTLLAAPDLTLDEKLATTEASVKRLLVAQADQAVALSAAHSAYQALGSAEQADAAADRILTEHPESPEAEWMLVSRYRKLREELGVEAENPDPEVRARYGAALREFIDRPVHHRDRLLGDAYRSLWWELDEDTEPAEFLEVTDGMVRYEGINPHIAYAEGAIRLAENTTFYARAEEIAREGVDVGRAKIESQRSFYSTLGDYDRRLNWMIAQMIDALGWVFFQADRLGEAEAELLRSHEMDPKARVNLFHLGQLYETLGHRQRAEDFYVQGLAVQQPGDNPSRAALEDLYAELYDNPDGFEAYLAEIEAREADSRYAEVLASRIETPERAPDFSLETLEGDSMSLDDLAGRVTVVNFWGIWCYWCIIEMPELQLLYDRYADDPDVTVVTINNDPNRDDVAPWMENNNYTFPVLFDDGYVTNHAAINSFPTTWVLDSAGRIAFVKESWSQELLEEFTWRIEALRRGPER